MGKNNDPIDLSVIDQITKNVDSYTSKQLIEINTEINELLNYSDTINHNFNPKITAKLTALNLAITRMDRKPYETNKPTDLGATSPQDELEIDKEEGSTTNLKTETIDLFGLKKIKMSFYLDQVALGFELRTPQGKMLKKCGPQKKFNLEVDQKDNVSKLLFLVPLFENGKEKQLEIKVPTNFEKTDFSIAIDIKYKWGDGEKELVIMINGSENESLGANEKYWNDDILKKLKEESGFEPSEFIFLDGDANGGVSDFVDTDSESFLKAKVFAENISSKSRYEKGKVAAHDQVDLIISKLKKEGGIDESTGLINRKIILMTHSRGGVFGEGFKNELLKIFKSSKYLDLFGSQDKVDELIDIVVNLDPHQSSMLDVKKGKAPTVNVSHEYSGLGGHYAVGDCVNIDTEQPGWKTHGNFTFSEEVPLIFDKHNENVIEGNDKYADYDGLLPNQDSFDSVEENLADSNSKAYKAYHSMKGIYENTIETMLTIPDIELGSDVILDPILDSISEKVESVADSIDPNSHWKSLPD
jgi:hypothetical protein